MRSSSIPPEMAPVGIIGAGSTGLLSALLLARMGIRSVLLERREDTSPHPRSLGVSRRSCEIFRHLGLLGELQARSLPMEGRSLAIWSRTTLTGEELGRIPHASLLSGVSPCTRLHCSQRMIEDVLLKALESEPLATLCYRNELVSVTGRPDGVRISLMNPDGAGEYFFPYLIAADGDESTTRRALGISFDGPADKGHYLNIFFRADFGDALENRKAAYYQALGANGGECFVAINGTDLWLMVHHLTPGETLGDYPSERLIDLVGRASGLSDEPIVIESVHLGVCSPKIASRFRQGRTFLLGEAATRLSPFGGLGVNIGLQSAFNLVWKIAAVLEGDASETLLESYHTECRERALALFNLTSHAPEHQQAIAACAEKGDWECVREKIKLSRMGGPGLGLDLGSGYESGAFVAEDTPLVVPTDPINDYTPSARPGSRAPHLWIRRGGKQISTLDLFGNRFSLLAGRQGRPWHAVEPLATVYQNGEAFTDDGGDFEPLYGITHTGAVLVRPDGVVAARFKERVDDPLETIRSTLKTILGEENLPASI